MQILHTPHLFSFPTKPLNPTPKFQPLHPHFPLSKPLNPRKSSIKCSPSGEFPVDETFSQDYAPKEPLTEEEARRLTWTELGWAPWEEILTPEGNFARTSINEGEQVPLQNPDSLEAFKMLKPSYRQKKIKELGITEDEFYERQFEIKTEIPEPLQTEWIGPVVFRHIPPRDWPPRGWEVDREELEFIRGAHKLSAVRVDEETLMREVKSDDKDMCLDRYKMFLKQYKEWVAANKDRLDEEADKYDPDYHPGRRKRGKDYKEGMYELPFYYPGQICEGKVTMVHLYQGAFVDIGGVHDGWVPIKGNDWFWLRHHIKVGMRVFVEILAKRDPYRFRFPIELRFVDPYVDHLIFNKFDFPPIFHRDEDTNLDELRRDCGRPPIPVKLPETKPEDEPLLSDHPYIEKIWQKHVAEQLILDDMEANPEKYKGKKISELTDDEDYSEETNVLQTKGYFKKTLLPKTSLKISVKELDLEAAFAERQLHNKLKREAKERGEEYKIEKLRRNHEMDEYDYMHWRRSFEEREALLRDISSRQALGLPLEEPGKYKEASFFRSKDRYDETDPLFQYDYWGEPETSEISKQRRMAEAHNKSIVGTDKPWYEISYDDLIEQNRKREARSKEMTEKEPEEDSKRDEVKDGEDEDDDYDEDFDFDYSILTGSSNVEFSDQPHINGSELSISED